MEVGPSADRFSTEKDRETVRKENRKGAHQCDAEKRLFQKLCGAVQKKPVKTKKLEASEKRLTLKAGSRTKLSVSVRPFTSQEKLKYRSSDCRIVTVSALGVVTARKKGKATILIRSGSQKRRVAVTVTAAGKIQKR